MDGPILILDDSPVIHRQLTTLLHDVAGPGILVVTATTVPEAERLFTTTRPRLVLLDLMLGTGESGIGLLRALDEMRVRTPAVVVSALHPEHEDVLAAIAAGATDYVRKPVHREELRSVLERVGFLPPRSPAAGEADASS